MVDTQILLTGVLVFLARICDVSIGTIRTIVTVQGRTAIAFVLAIFEITIWVTVAGTVINQIKDQPLLVVFYAFGYATGNVVGIMVERKLAFGTTILRIITRTAGEEMAAHLREKGQPVTVFNGEGMQGPVHELYIACRRRDLKWILPEVRQIDPKLFYVIEQARDMSKVLKPVYSPLGGWRSVGKRK
ncbi:DUF5698 domain-containing protein [uncultured Desulfosarcina sp.]|uniref:DUF2179 domain-containing protein n=1 Tax=uncultured Desulfosarcina sp. TaxID=218289 RepID=UPI0029C862AB|nr:DUF5698 domain-containing protein [uncultured Desulfosarcina sp.]